MYPGYFDLQLNQRSPHLKLRNLCLKSLHKHGGNIICNRKLFSKINARTLKSKFI